MFTKCLQIFVVITFWFLTWRWAKSLGPIWIDTMKLNPAKALWLTLTQTLQSSPHNTIIHWRKQNRRGTTHKDNHINTPRRIYTGSKKLGAFCAVNQFSSFECLWGQSRPPFLESQTQVAEVGFAYTWQLDDVASVRQAKSNHSRSTVFIEHNTKNIISIYFSCSRKVHHGKIPSHDFAGTRGGPWTNGYPRVPVTTSNSGWRP